MSKKSTINRFLKENGIKKSWMAQQLGMSVECLRYHTAAGKRDLDDKLKRKAKDKLLQLAEKIENFALEK